MIRLILNTLSFLIAIAVNYYAATGQFNGKTVGEVSRKYESLFAPADYAFSIWGLIYLLLLFFVIFQWYSYFKERDKRLIPKIGLWFMMSNLFNSLWLIAWLMENLAFSVILMFFLLYSLIRLVRRLNMEKWDAPLRIIAFVWWPICIYLGWIIVAFVANVAAFLIQIDWDGYIFSEEVWTIIMITIGTIIYLLLTKRRNMREASLVGAWAFIAIAVKHWEMYDKIVITSIAATVILLASAGYHAYKNLESSPIKKLRKK